MKLSNKASAGFLLIGAMIISAHFLNAAATEAGPMDHQESMQGTAINESATSAYQKVNARMHSQMNIEYSGDPDIDFVRGMIPHHKGAVDMCKVQLEYGTDPEIIQLCNNIVAAQNTEIEFMQNWLASKNMK